MSKKLIYCIFFISLCLVCGSVFLIKYLSPPPKAKSYEIAKTGKASIGGDFDLIDFNGEKITSDDFKGQYLLVYFGFTFCPDICPTALYNIKETFQRLPVEIQGTLVPIFITIDPERDDVQNMRNYMQQFDNVIIGLTGSPSQIAHAMKQYKIYSQKIENEHDPKNYLMNHSSLIYFMDRNGEYIGHFAHTTSPEEMTDFITKKVRELESK